MSAAEKLIKIGELARRTNRTVRALRLYEEVGVLAPAERTQSGYRLYDEGNIERLDYIDRLQRIGLSLNEICAIVEDWGAGSSPREAMDIVRSVYREKLAAVRERLEELRGLEKELMGSIGYLERCCDCAHASGDAETSCGPCVQGAKKEETVPTLISGLTAH